MANKVEELEARIAALNLELERTKAAKNAFDSLPDEYKLAEEMHKKMCHINHEDGCDYYYGEWTASQLNYGHRTYLGKARGLLKIIPDYDMCLQIVEAITK